MIKNILSGLLTLLAVCFVNAQNVSIPDPNFKNFLVNHSYNTNPTGIGNQIYLDSNHDGEIQYSEAAGYSSDVFNHAFYLQGLNISDLTGIDAFDSLEQINISDNPLSTIDISGCLSLKRLNATYNNLFTIFNPVSATLEEVDINSPTFTSADFGGCPALKIIKCSNNPILTNVSINGCNALEELQAYQNPMLTTLTMGSHYNMTHFQVQSNQLTAIDVSSCHSLEYFFVTGNPLISLNMANGNPQSFVQIIAEGFPDLTCITVNNVAVCEYLWTQTGGYYIFDEWANFSTDCSPAGPCVVTIPDVNFKTELVANAAVNTNGNTEIECTEAEAYTGTINLENYNISDLTGIKAFINLTAFSYNNGSWDFTSLDVSGMTSLTTISCTGNVFFTSLNASSCTALTSIDVSSFIDLSLDLSGCIALPSLDLDNKHLISLDVSGCSSLTSLSCSTNSLTELDLTGCNALTSINCSNNNITSLTVSNILPLVNLDCSDNELSLLNVINNPLLSVLNCASNLLPYLIVSTNTALTQLNCSTNNLTYLDVNNNLSLSDLNCSHNNLNTLNVSSSAALYNFNCSYNNLSSINVNSNTALSFFDCSHNNIGSLEVSSNAALISLYCDTNDLTNLNVSSNSNLKYFSCSNNLLPAINLSGTAALLSFNCSYNQLTALDLSVTPMLTQLTCTGNQLTALDLSNTHCMLLYCDNNQLESLNIANGYNVNVFGIVANNNGALSCVQVDDEAFSTANWTDSNFIFDAGVSFSENCALGLVEVTHNQFRVYPNPTHNVIYFSKPAHIQIYNITGQILANKQCVEMFDLTNHPSGLYLITFLDDSGQVIQQSKIVKN
jgi:Leucine-rich repeat (LRR) protein